MGSRLFDAWIKKYRQDLLTRQTQSPVTITKPLGQVTKGQAFAGPFVDYPIGVGSEVDWEAFRVYTDTGVGLGIDNLEFERSVDFRANGRIGVMWTGDDGTLRHVFQFSDDDGETWSAADISSVGTLGSSIVRYGGMVAWNDKFMAFIRGSIGVDEAKKIYRKTWDGSWGAASLWYFRGAGFTPSRVRPSRSADRTVAAVAFVEFDGATFTARYVPMDGVGDPGVAEDVGAVPGGLDTTAFDLALVFEGTDPTVIVTSAGFMAKKKKSGGVWPGAWTTITIDDPPTSPEILTVLNGDGVTITPVWGGGTFVTPFSGDAFALKNQGGRTFRYRRRVGGTWSQDDIDFGALASNPMSGADSTTYSGEHSASVFQKNDKTYVLAWMGNAAFSLQSLWMLRR